MPTNKEVFKFFEMTKNALLNFIKYRCEFIGVTERGDFCCKIYAINTKCI